MKPILEVKVKNITKENFQKYGSVLVETHGAPTSQSGEYKFWSNIIDYKIDGETEVGVCTVFKQKENVLNRMERHLKTPEILIPIDAPFILPLLNEKDNPEKTEAFRVNVGQVVKINNSVWHGACLPAGSDETSYFVIFKKGTPFNDIEKKTFEPIKINV